MRVLEGLLLEVRSLVPKLGRDALVGETVDELLGRLVGVKPANVLVMQKTSSNSHDKRVAAGADVSVRLAWELLNHVVRHSARVLDLDRDHTPKVLAQPLKVTLGERAGRVGNEDWSQSKAQMLQTHHCGSRRRPRRHRRGRRRCRRGWRPANA